MSPWLGSGDRVGEVAASETALEGEAVLEVEGVSSEP